MTRRPAHGALRALVELLGSPVFARAYTLTVYGAAFGSFAIEHIAGRVTLGAIIVGLCLIGAVVLVVRRRELSLVRLMPTTLALFLLWMLASTLWSGDRGATFTSWLGVAGYAFLAVVVAHVRDTLQGVRALADVMRALLLVSLGVEVLSGIILDMPFRFLGVEGNIAELGPVQGIFGTRNALGFVAVIAIIAFVIEFRTQSVRPGLSIFSVVLGGALAGLSDSPTVLVLAVAVAIATGALALVRHARPEHRLTLQWTLGALVGLALIVGYVARRPIVALLGAGSDLSTRLNLWNAVYDYTTRFYPIRGWGWFGPWRLDELPFSAINYGLDDRHASALNAYFDVLLQLGWVGLVLFLGFVGVALVRAWVDASARRSVVYATAPLLLITLLVNSMFESFTLTGFGWMLLVLCAVRAGQSRSWREKLDEASGDGSGLPHPTDDLPPAG